MGRAEKQKTELYSFIESRFGKDNELSDLLKKGLILLPEEICEFAQYELVLVNVRNPMFFEAEHLFDFQNGTTKDLILLPQIFFTENEEGQIFNLTHEIAHAYIHKQNKSPETEICVEDEEVFPIDKAPLEDRANKLARQWLGESYEPIFRKYNLGWETILKTRAESQRKTD